MLVSKKMDGKVWVCFVLFSIAGAKNDRGKLVQLSKFFIIAKVKCFSTVFGLLLSPLEEFYEVDD